MSQALAKKSKVKKEVVDLFTKVTKEEQDGFRKKLDVIIFGFAHHFPFFGSVSERCRYSLTKDDNFIPTAGIDKNGHIIFNLNFVNSLDNKQFLFLVAHEIGHFIFEHSARIMSRNHRLWNVAADYAINLFLYYQFGSKEYFPMIDKICFDKDWSVSSSDNKYDKMNVEQIYNIVEKEAEKLPKIKIDVFIESFDENEGEDNQDQDEDGDGNGKKYVDIRERRVPLPKKKGKTKEQIGREMKDYVRRAVSDAFNISKSQGLLPAGMERMIVSHLRPKIDWLSKLREKLRFGTDRLAKADTNWSMPNKRFLDRDFVFPSYHGPNQPKIAYAIDTSGSMSEEDLKNAISELDGIRKQMNANIYFMDCDADVYTGRWINSNQPLPCLQGGGGTDFVPVFKHLVDKKIRPDYCVFFTDGYGEFGEDPKKFNTLWVLTSDVKPPFGDVIRYNDLQ